MQHGAISGVQGGIAVGPGAVLERRTALPLGDAGKLPSIHGTSSELVAMHGTRKVDDVGRIEDVSAIIRQNSVVGAEIVGILGCTGLVAIESLAIARSQHLAEGVVGSERHAPSLLLPSDDHSVVVGNTAMSEQLDAGVVVMRVIIVGVEAATKGIIDFTGKRVRLKESAQRNQIHIGQCAVQNLVAAGAPVIPDFNQGSPGRALRNGEVVSDSIRSSCVAFLIHAIGGASKPWRSQ